MQLKVIGLWRWEDPCDVLSYTSAEYQFWDWLSNFVQCPGQPLVARMTRTKGGTAEVGVLIWCGDTTPSARVAELHVAYYRGELAVLADDLRQMDGIPLEFLKNAGDTMVVLRPWVWHVRTRVGPVVALRLKRETPQKRVYMGHECANCRIELYEEDQDWLTTFPLHSGAASSESVCQIFDSAVCEQLPVVLLRLIVDYCMIPAVLRERSHLSPPHEG